MKKRTFITTLALFLVFLNGLLCMIISFMLKERIEGIKERALSEHYMLTSMMWKDISSFQDREGFSAEDLKSGLSQYKELIRNRNTAIVLCDNTSVIFQNGQIGEGALELLNRKASELKDGNRGAFFMGEEEPVYYIVGKLPFPLENYRLYYGSRIVDAIQEWKEFRFLLLTSGAMGSALLAGCLLLLIQAIFRPLGVISEISGEIARGQYEKRLPLDGKEEILNMAVSFNDMADKIENQIGALNMAARQKQEFIDNFAHELKTPLTAIYGYAEYLQKAVCTEEDRQEALQFIMSECRRIQNMEKQLLDMALLRENDFIDENIPAGDFFNELYGSLRPKAAQKKIHLTFTVEVESIYGNRGLLHHLLTNLITNGIHSCREGGSVMVRAYQERDGKCITVRDNGKGMEKSEISHITEAFYRVDKSRSREEGGAGLGLAICTKIAEIEKIKLRFVSQPDKGTVVYINFTTP